MNTITRHESDARLSRLVTHNGIAYLAGLTADDRKAGVKGQTEQILRKIDELLARAGTDKTRLLSAVIYLSDIRSKGPMDEAWAGWINAKDTPARACIEARLGTADTLVEIMVVAAQ